MTKNGFDTLEVDVNIFEDLRVRKLIKRQGAAAFAVLMEMQCRITAAGPAVRRDKELTFLIAERLGLTEEYVEAVIRECVRVELLAEFTSREDKEKCVSSAELQRTYMRECMRRGRKVFKPKELCLLTGRERDRAMAWEAKRKEG